MCDTKRIWIIDLYGPHDFVAPFNSVMTEPMTHEEAEQYACELVQENNEYNEVDGEDGYSSILREHDEEED